MRVGYFITHFPYRDRLNDMDYFSQYHHGGTETVAYNLAYNIAQRTHDVHVFTTSIDQNNSVEKNNHLTIHRYANRIKIENTIISPGIFTDPLNHQVDVVHVHAGLPPADIAALLYTTKMNIPFVLTLHGDPQDNYGSIIRRACLFPYCKYFLNRLLSSAKIIISPSRRFIMESRFLKRYEDKVVIIPHGVNIDEFEVSFPREICKQKLHLLSDEKVILFLGALAPYKGPDILLKAFGIVLKHNSNIKLIFAGDGTLKEELKEIAQKAGIDEHIRFVGFIKEKLKPMYFNIADIFVLPSTVTLEMFGIVNLEAMACSVPIIASEIGGIPDVIKDEENGLLVPPKDPEALAKAIIKLLNNEELALKLGETGRKMVQQKYKWNIVAQETEKVYENMFHV